MTKQLYATETSIVSRKLILEQAHNTQSACPAAWQLFMNLTQHCRQPYARAECADASPPLTSDQGSARNDVFRAVIIKIWMVGFRHNMDDADPLGCSSRPRAILIGPHHPLPHRLCKQQPPHEHRRAVGSSSLCSASAMVMYVDSWNRAPHPSQVMVKHNRAGRQVH